MTKKYGFKIVHDSFTPFATKHIAFTINKLYKLMRRKKNEIYSVFVYVCVRECQKVRREYHINIYSNVGENQVCVYVTEEK